MDELAQTIITILSSEVEEMRIAVDKFVDAYSALTDWYWEWMLERKNRRKARFRRKLKSTIFSELIMKDGILNDDMKGWI